MTPVEENRVQFNPTSRGSAVSSWPGWSNPAGADWEQLASFAVLRRKHSVETRAAIDCYCLITVM